MSRTYRFKKATPNELGLSKTWFYFSFKKDRKDDFNIYLNFSLKYNPNLINIDPFSKEGKKKIALLFSDKKKGVMIGNGPSWFNNLMSQRPHRSDAKSQLDKFVKKYNQRGYVNIFDLEIIDDDVSLNLQFHPVLKRYYWEVEDDIIIDKKPKRQYWW